MFQKKDIKHDKKKKKKKKHDISKKINKSRRVNDMLFLDEASK